jgi:folate/biopterin transporter
MTFGLKQYFKTINLNYLVITLVAFSQGITGLSDLAVSYLYKDDLRLTPSEVSRINSLLTIPWIVKPIYGLISDSFPIFGFRRKPYLFIFGLCVSFCWVMMSVYVDNLSKAFTTILMAQIATAFCNVIGEALVVETSQQQKELDPSAGAKNVSWYFLVKSIGSLLTAFSSGALLEYMDKRNVFLITASFPLIIVVSSLVLQEDRLKAEEVSLPNGASYDTIAQSNLPNVQSNKKDLKEQLDLFISFVKQEQIYKPVIFILLYLSTPSYGDPMFYFYTNELKFTPLVMGRLRLIYGIASVLGIILYNKYLKNINFKKLMVASTIVSVSFNLLAMVLVSRLNLTLGIPDIWFCMGADALTTALAEINSMPLLVLACEICPKNIEGTLYAFLMSVMNFGSLVSNQTGSILTSALGITNNNFTNLTWMILIANVIYLLPLPSLLIIKDHKPIEDDMYDMDNTRMSERDEEVKVK